MSAREHAEARDLLAPVALGAADPSEVARVRAHVARCAVCAEELAALRADAELLATAVPQLDPPRGLRGRVLAAVAAEAYRPAPAAEPARARQGLWARLRPPRRWAVALAATAAAAAVLLGWNIALQLRDEGDPGLSAQAIRGTPAMPGISGRVVLMADQDAMVSLSRLDPLPPGQAYQLWVVQDGRARSAGLFTSTGGDSAVALASGVEGAQALAVTAQPAASRTVPEGPKLVEVALGEG